MNKLSLYNYVLTCMEIRFLIGQYTNVHREVISHVNITSVRNSDSGEIDICFISLNYIVGILINRLLLQKSVFYIKNVNFSILVLHVSLL